MRERRRQEKGDDPMGENGIESESSEAAPRAPSQFEAPQISLPKGGGAIRGIDEKFTANPSTGTGSLTIPLALSAGRSGFGPQLSLTYDSGQGNGPYGIGWSLSLPKIALRTDNGLPCYGKDDRREKHCQQTEERDTFVLSGAEDLVAVLDRDNSGNLHVEEFDRDGHRVRRYRPRIEGLFARIERWTCLATGVAHWRSLSRDNVLTVYGLDAASRIADPADPTHVFNWLICRSYDDRGNAIVYDYAGENDCGIDLCRSSERARSHTANRYLKCIRYGNRTPLFLDMGNPSCRPSHLSPHDLNAAEWMFEAVFDYGEGHYSENPPDETGNVHSIAFLEPQCGWATRKDSFSNYRAGFEVRTHRLCRRVLMYHHFEHELGAPSVLVRSTALHYREQSLGSFIERVVTSGHRHLGNGQYLTRSLPPLDFSYTLSPLENPSFDGYELRYASPESLENLPAAVGNGAYRFVDLDGEGIAGVLAEQDATWFYMPNRGEGRLGPIETVQLRPAHVDLPSGRQQLMDMSGDGVPDIVEFSPVAGFYERTDDASWEGFRAFQSCPVQDWDDPNLRFVDLTGDGFADMLVTEDEVLRWHRSLGKEGFGPGIRVAVPLDEVHGPRILFNDGNQSVYLADMSGDGLADIVRICNGNISYWPNMGYGRFGAMVTMERAPRFDEPDLFDHQRIRLADIDGSGTTDLLYLGRDGIHVYLNQAGNAWSDVRNLRCFPRVDDLASVTVSDFLGRGTACLVWSSSLPGDFGRHIRYIDLMCGVKPHLLSQIKNNLGAETRIAYASSTQFYLADRAAGKPWLTRLPFPIHVVEHIESYDHVSRNRFVTRYSYHHGYYDKEDREFRGFGRVDQVDTEKIGALMSVSGAAECTNTDAASSLPPVLTRTWFHTGVFLKGGHISRHLSQEYYDEGSLYDTKHQSGPDLATAFRLEDTVLPHGLTLAEAREASRALKGSVLRQEIYALDGKEESCRPYTVTESNLGVRLLQPHGPNRHAVLLTHTREQVSFAYERKLYEIAGCLRADPRITHNIALEVDDYGNVLKSVAIAYARQITENVPDFQKRTLLTLAESDYTNQVDYDDAYRMPMPAEQRLIELRGVTPDCRACGVTGLFRFGEIAEKITQLSGTAYDIPHGAWHSDDERIGRRLLKKVRTRYRSNDLTTLLSVGNLQSMAFPGENYRLATPGTSLRNLIGSREESLRTEGGYVDLDHDGEWWAPSGRVFYTSEQEATAEDELRNGAAHFFLGRRYVDPFGNTTSVSMDTHDLLPVATTDAVGNVTNMQIDYRVLAPRRQIDANGNCTEVAFDVLGLVAGTAVRGKENEAMGDSLEGFDPDLDPQTIRAFLDDPHAYAYLLGRATTRVLHDVDRYSYSGKPAFAATVLRETHDSDLAPGQQTRTQISIAFSDGFGREVQQKRQAEPCPVIPGGEPIAHRWIGTGWTIFNNKGKPVRKYEPFFSAVADFEFAAINGVSPILLYDPLARMIATLRPDHTFEKVVFDPWRQFKWDVNDTVLLNPKTDPDVGQLVSRLPESDFFPTWYLARITGALGEAERKAALGAAHHAGTPNSVYLNSLGHTILTVADNGVDTDGKPREYASLAVVDVEGNCREVIDALGRSVMQYGYDLSGRCVHQLSMEAGERWTLTDVSGKPIRSWNSRLYMFRTEYDKLRRPVRRFALGGDQYERNASPHACEVMFEKTIYGDSEESGLTPHRQRTANLRGRVFRHFDTAGVTTAEQYDFKGNISQTSRQFTCDYRSVPDWSKSPTIEVRKYEGGTTYDALSRVVTSTSPDGSIYRPTYNDAGLIERIDVALHATRCQQLPSSWTPFVRNIDYNARGQRVRIDYANGVTTISEYDSTTFRLSRLQTMRAIDCEIPSAQIFASPGCIQNLRYHYDPIGNIIETCDSALKTVFHDNRRIDATCRYAYDALYRLVSATGRKQALQSAFQFGPADSDYRCYPFAGISATGDLQSLEPYTETYQYDAVGNFLSTAHRSPHNSWTRHYAYQEGSLIEPRQYSNRLSNTQIGTENASSRETYQYDANGNIVQMPHLPIMRWNFLDRFTSSSKQVINCGTPETTYYVYDGSGARVRKVTERANGSRKSERLYVGSFELFHEFDAGGDEITLERETLHVMDNQQRVALVETLTIDRDNPLLSKAALQRFQLANHLGSSSIELDEAAGLISYEEYAPYGTTTFQTGRSANEVRAKRYRYSGKERDAESGFLYYGARYYAPWLGRWVSCDPSGLAEGTNLYLFVSANPIRVIDPNGAAGQPPPGLIADHPEYLELWNKAVQRVLEPKFGGGSVNENLSRFSEHIRETAETVGMGSNRQVGTARNIARETYSRTRTVFGRLAEEAGLSVKGTQIHHAIDELARDPTKALNPENLSIVTGNAGTEGTLHNLGHASLEKNLARLEAFKAKWAAEGAKELESAAPALESAAPALESATKELGVLKGLVRGAGPILKVVKPLAVIATVITATEQVAHAASDAPVTNDPATKMEQQFEKAENLAGAVANIATLAPGPVGMIAGGAQLQAEAAKAGIHATGGDERIVAAGKATENFAKEHGWSDVNAETAGATAAAITSIGEGSRVIGELSMGPIGWGMLAVRSWKKF